MMRLGWGLLMVDAFAPVVADSTIFHTPWIGHAAEPSCADTAAGTVRHRPITKARHNMWVSFDRHVWLMEGSIPGMQSQPAPQYIRRRVPCTPAAAQRAKEAS